MTIYDRTVARFSRRELMKIGWTLGAAAVAQPFLERRLLAKPIFESYPFSLGVAPAIRCPTASCSGRVWRPSRSKAAACR